MKEVTASGPWAYYLPFSKVSTQPDGTCYVEAVATAEVLDSQGEVVTHDASTAAFSEWTAGFARATDGKSLGNIREMHEPWAAGKAVRWVQDDTNRRQVLALHVVDQDAAAKCRERVYTGLSIGGRDVRRGTLNLDGESVPCITGYTLTEVSLVDKPACPEALFMVVKRATPEESKMEKDAVTAVAAGEMAIENLKAMLAEIAGLEGDPQTFTMEAILDALRSTRVAVRETTMAVAMDAADAAEDALEGETEAPGGGMEMAEMPESTPESTQEQPDSVTIPAEDGDAAPVPAGAPEPEPEDEDVKNLVALVQELAKAVQEVQKTLAKVAEGGLVKSAATVQDLAETLARVEARVNAIPAAPPGRPVAKDLGTLNQPGAAATKTDMDVADALDVLEKSGLLPDHVRTQVRVAMAATLVPGR